MIWEPFVLALFLGLIVSAGLYFAYLWPQVEPRDGEPVIVPGDSMAAHLLRADAEVEPVSDDAEDTAAPAPAGDVEVPEAAATAEPAAAASPAASDEPSSTS